MLRRVIQGAVIGLVATLVAVGLDTVGGLQWLENPFWDARVRIFAGPGDATDDIRLVLIDQYSLDWVEENLGEGWPWPRELYQPILHACRAGGAKAIVFDMLYSEPSARGVSDDIAFGQTIRDTPHFVCAFWLSREQGDHTWADHVNANRFPTDALPLSGPIGRFATVPYATFPFYRLATNMTTLGTILTDQDADAVIRRMPAFHIFDNHFVPVLGLAGALTEHQSDLAPSIRDDRLLIGDYRIPIDKQGRVIPRYRGGSQSHKAINAALVMQSGIQLLEGDQPSMDVSSFKDTTVFLGTTAPGILDLRPTPLSKTYPGVEIHATLLDNLLSNDFIQDAPWLVVIALALLLAIASGVTIRLGQKGGMEVALAVIMTGLPIAIGFLAYPQGYWMPVAMPFTATALALASALTVNYAVEGRQKRFIRSAFKQYLSPAVVERIADNPANLKLGGEKRELSIYFSDVQGFTTISESLTPEELTALLNAYLTAMTDIILESGGTIDKYEGDAIIAFWNAPLDLEDHAIRAVRAALTCQQTILEMRPALKETYGRDIYARIGLNTGPVVVGNMGSHQRFDYTFLGDAGNLAARLEGINKQFGTYIMISQNTLDQLDGTFAVRELSRVRVVGKVEPVTVYEPMFKEAFEERRDLYTRFNKGLQAYYQGHFESALALFQADEVVDPPSAAYIRKCRAMMANPPATWDGVWVMTEK